MPNITGTTRAQTLFLRAFRTSTTGPAPADWPSPAILRKWLRKPAFRKALATIQESLHFQPDFQVASAATTAARKLLAEVAAPPPPLPIQVPPTPVQQQWPLENGQPTADHEPMTQDK